MSYFNTVILSKRYILVYISAILISLSYQSVFAQEQKKSNMSIEEMMSLIDKTIDPEFIYEYEKTKYVPPKGKTLLFMGQASERISEYMNEFPDQDIPSGWSAYWGVSEFKGITEPYRNVTGNTQHHQMIIDEFPNTVIHSAMWMVGKWDIAKNTGNGAYDKVIKQFSAWATAANRPIYLRIGYEFDGPHNELEPDEYVKAYKHIVDLIRAEGANNIAFVWHSYASKPYKDYPLSSWYPGDDYVDWVAISVFGHAYNGRDFGSYCENVLNFAKQYKKPVMIAESSPINGIDKENAEVWRNWFANYFTFIYNKNIKAISFINEDWPSLEIEGISEWKDSRLYNNKKVSEAWFKEVNNDCYLKQSPELFNEIGYQYSDSLSFETNIKQEEEVESIEYIIPKVNLPFYVYQDGDNTPYFPSAFMGNYKALSVDFKNTEDVQSGTYALKIKYDAESDWYGLAMVNPADDWGDLAGGYDISGAKTFSFWAKCTQDDRNANIGFGLIKNDKPFPDSTIRMKEINLSTKWKKYTFKLKKEDLSCIRSGFVIFSTGFKQGHEIFIDNVVFE